MILLNKKRGSAVTCNFWARVLCNLAAEDACFRMRITLGVVLIRSLGFVLKVLAVIEPQYWFATSFIFSELFRSGSGFWSEVSFNDVVCESTSFLCFSWGVCVFSLVSAVESFWILANLNYPQIAPEVAARQHMGLEEYSSVGFRSVSHRSGVKTWHF